VNPERAIKENLDLGEMPKALEKEHEAIDNAFEKLISALNVGATTEEILDLTDIVANFCETHFATEEQFFHDCLYPGSDEHAKMHKRILSRLREIRNAISAGNQGVRAECSEMRDSLHDHIARFDRPAFKWRQGIMVFELPSPAFANTPAHAPHVCRVDRAFEDLKHPDPNEPLTGCLYCGQPTIG
jgi:hemerythrin-like metal-binding protein